MRRAEEIVAELEKQLDKAKPVPLTDQVRLERKRFQELLTELREALSAGRL